MSDAPKQVSRRMKYPYTYTAQIAQFPYKHYWKHSWLARYWIYGIIVSLPIFYKIQKGVNSPANVALWEEKARQEAAEYAHH